MKHQILCLKHLAQIKASNVDKTSVEGEIPVRLCNYVDVYHNEAITQTLEFMQATATPRQVQEFSLRRGDILITKDSETADDIGVPAFVPDSLPGVICGYHLSLIRPIRSLVAPRYLYWALLGEATRAYFTVHANGVTRFALGYGAIGGTPIHVPPLDAQRVIVRFLDEETARIEALIEKKKNLLVLLEQERTSVTADAVTKGLQRDARMRPSGIDWIGYVPAHWSIRRIKHVARLASGHTPSRSRADYWLNPVIPWFQLTDIWQFRDDSKEYLLDTAEMISELGLRHSAAELLPKGTVALSRTASVGFSAILGRDMATTQDFANWIPGTLVESRYLLYVLRTMRPELERLRFGSTHKTIYMSDVGKLVMPLPPRNEQREIVDYIRAQANGLGELRARVDAAIRQLAEYRSALITAAVTGQIDVAGAG